MQQQLETWAIHSRINQYLLESVAEENLPLVGPAKGRSVGAQFAHIHNVRLMWLKAAAPDLLEGLEKVAEEGANLRATLLGALAQSSMAIDQLLVRAMGPDGKIKGFKPHPTAFLGYLISHESHHRGQIVLTLKQVGHPVPKSVLFGLWEWGVR